MRIYLKKVRKELIMYIIIISISYFMYSMIPYFTKRLFEGEFFYAIVGYTMCFLFFIFFAYLANLLQIRYIKKFDQILKENYFKKVINMNHQDFSRKKVGEYISFQANDITEIGNSYLSPIMGIITQTIRVIMVFAVIVFVLNIKIAILLILATLLGVFLPKSLGKETARRRTRYLECQKKYYSKIEEFFNGHKVVNERTVTNIIQNHNAILDEVLQERFYYGKANSLMWAMHGFGAEGISYLIFLYLGFLLFQGYITASFAVATFQYAQSLSEPVQQILYNKNMIHSAEKLVQDFLDFINDTNNKKNKEICNVFQELELKQIGIDFGSFKLKNINLKIEKNKKYALIGANGSGKSTLFHILSSYIQEYEGELLIDGRNIKELDVSFLIGIMDQDEYIFSEDYNTNITVFESYPKQVNNIFFEKHTKLEDCKNCKQLSGGEKDVIGLQRVYNKSTPILLLDEPLAAVDERKKERLLQKILQMDKTVIMITHDIGKSLNEFDFVLFMQNGEILYNLPYDKLKNRKEYLELIDKSNL